ncbi:S24/S26 family peptidase [Actinoplanes sp. NPDC049802]|uniref:S24/S26 family peptidase n=1 Tax=Actinoplanes sp. NPDC049802 TaxID=3154742 RepID=UPI0033F46FE0
MTNGVPAAVAVVLAGGALAVARRRFLLIDVAGDSMTPALGPGDRLLVRRTRRGDVVGRLRSAA